jgi:hypothetical protein
MTAAQMIRTLTPRTLVSRTLFAGIAAVALTAAGFGFAQGLSQNGSAIEIGGERWSDAFDGTDQPHLNPSAETTKSDRLDVTCETQDWPYLGEKCLVAAAGTEFRTATRTVTIEHRMASENTSVLVRVPVQEVALQ